MGLTNQMFSLSNGIDEAIKNNCNAVVIDTFLCDYSINKYTNISNVLDLEEMNTYVKQKYNLLLVDKNHFDFELLNVYYGTEKNQLDITQKIRQYYYHNRKLYINKN